MKYRDATASLRSFRAWSILFAVLLAFAVGASGQESDDTDDEKESPEQGGKAPEKAELGEEVPGFTLPDETGRERSLSDYEGRIVVLEWTDKQCPAVQQQYGAKAVQETYEQVKEIDGTVAWLSINSTAGNSARENEFWKKRYGLEWPILMDRGGAVAGKYGVRRIPHMFVIDEEGVLRYHGALHNDYPPTRQQGDVTNYVVQAVRALADGEVVSTDYVEPWGCFVRYEK